MHANAPTGRTTPHRTAPQREEQRHARPVRNEQAVHGIDPQTDGGRTEAERVERDTHGQQRLERHEALRRCGARTWIEPIENVLSGWYTCRSILHDTWHTTHIVRTATGHVSRARLLSGPAHVAHVRHETPERRQASKSQRCSATRWRHPCTVATVIWHGCNSLH